MSDAAVAEGRLISLSDILRTDRYRVRKVDAATVRRYESVLRLGGTLPPVALAHVAGTLVLVDGWHRVAAHELAGIPDVIATITEATDREALAMAARANLTNGRPLRNPEIRQCFRKLIEARVHVLPGGGLRSFRDLAVDLGGLVGKSTVHRWMARDFPQIARRYQHEEGNHGKGGLVEHVEADPLGVAALAAIGEARNAARAVADPEMRGDLIEATEALLKELRESGRWSPRDF